MGVTILEEELRSGVYNINGMVVTSWDIYTQMLPYRNTTNKVIPKLTYREVYDLLKVFARHIYVETNIVSNKTMYVVYLDLNRYYPTNNFFYKPIAYTDNIEDLMEYLHRVWCVPLNKNNKKPETLKETNDWIKEAGGGNKIKVKGYGLNRGQYELVNSYNGEKQIFNANNVDEILNTVLLNCPFILKTWI